MATERTSIIAAPGSRVSWALTVVNDVIVVVAIVAAFATIVVPGQPALEALIGVLVMVGCVLAWPRSGRLMRLCTAGSLAVGVIAALAVDASLPDIAAGLTQMTLLFAFLVVVRLLEVPILTGRFNDAFAHWVAERRHFRRRSMAGSAVTFGLTSGLSIGAVPIAYRSVEALWRGAHEPDDVRSVMRVVTRAFTAGNSWTPVSPIVALSVQLTRAPLTTVLLWAVPMVLVAAVATAIAVRASGDVEQTPAIPGTRGVGEMALWAVALIVAITGLDAALGIGPVGATMICIVGIGVLWQSTLEGPRRAVRSLLRSFAGQRAAWSEQFALFCAGGVLVGAAQTFSRVGSVGSLGRHPLPVLLLLPAVIVALALLSLYPLVSLAAFGALLGPQVGAEAAVALALSLIIGTSVGFMISPFSGLTLLVAAMSGRSPLEVGLRSNIGFAMSCLVAGTGIVALTYAMG